MSQMNKTLRPLRVTTTRRPHLIETILCWKAITFHLTSSKRETLTEHKWGGSIFNSSCSSALTISNQVRSNPSVQEQAFITLEREVTRPAVESDEPILPSPGANCENQSSPTNSINYITCVSDYFQKQLDMLYPYQLENLTSLVNGNLVLLERKYRAHPNLELWERLIDMHLVYSNLQRENWGLVMGVYLLNSFRRYKLFDVSV